MSSTSASGDIDTAGMPTSSEPIEGGVVILNGAVRPGADGHELWRSPTNDELAETADRSRVFAITTDQGRRAMLRIERDRRLVETDWTELPSAAKRLSAAELAAWATYRQALRDLPADTADPDNPPWPIPPGATVEGSGAAPGAAVPSKP